MLRTIALGLSLLLGVLAAPAAPAEADGRRGGPAPHRRDLHGRFHGKQLHGHGHGHGSKVIILPQPVYVVPSRCWTEGSWAYQWVPQTYAYNTWVPGQWSPEGTWVEGHYEARYQTGGQYHPYWVPGYWTGC
ncbi:MAG TPA: hypothetical protein VFX28_06040 [Methylomirabilota bacterium]|nr:hypothetical protein [Methylomirabilota bacterium]